MSLKLRVTYAQIKQESTGLREYKGSSSHTATTLNRNNDLTVNKHDPRISSSTFKLQEAEPMWVESYQTALMHVKSQTRSFFFELIRTVGSAAACTVHAVSGHSDDSTSESRRPSEISSRFWI